MAGKSCGQAVRGGDRPAARPLLPGAARWPVVAVVVVCVLVVAAQVVWRRHGMEASPVNAAVDASVRAGLGGHRLLLAVLVWPGRPVPVTVMASALALACVLRRRYDEAALVAVAVPLAAGLTELVLKPLAGRTPWGTPFPSGHVTCVAALATVLAVVLTRAPAGASPLRLAAAAAGFLAVAAVAAGVIGSNMHHFADIIGGAAVGSGTVLATAFPFDLFRARRCQRGESQPAPAA
jgi:membrane-associated phospholipid phosphatase